MESVCRLCCSTRFVNNYIFDEENALHLKMSLYLPIKILKDDLLPQKICDKCSCKVNDLYQFCNESMEAQSKLETALNIKETKEKDISVKDNSCAQNSKPILTTQSTQTEEKSSEDFSHFEVKVKEEPKPVKEEEEDDDNNFAQLDGFDGNESDNSENMTLIDLKLAKTSSMLPESASVSQLGNDKPLFMPKSSSPTNNLKKTVNGKKARKRNVDLDEWTPFMRAMPEGTSITVIKGNLSKQLKLEMKEEVEEVVPSELGLHVHKKEKLIIGSFSCCVCLWETDSRAELLQHYRRHADSEEMQVRPPPTPPPIEEPTRCARCRKKVEVNMWATHWRKHWERDRRPYRCSLCGNTFRDHSGIFRHGLTHKTSGDEPEVPQTPENRFLCDLCPEEFYYMKSAQAHRLRAHPESLTTTFRLRCAECLRTFAHLNSLRRHVRGHSGKRDFLCNICGKSLTSKEHLKFHIRIHENVKPNVCKTCGKAFVKKTNLTMHERVHTGEKPYACSHCGKAFSQRSTLVIHERYHSGARPYVCKLCGRGFVAKGLLSMHLKVACI